MPQEKKEALRQRVLFRHFIGQEIVTAMIILSLCAFLWIILLILQFESNSLSQSYEMGNAKDDRYKKMSEYEKEFRLINADMKFAQLAFDAQGIKTPILEGIGLAVPKGIIIDSVTINEEGVFVRGLSESRDSLGTFEENLKKNECFLKVVVPLESLVQKNNSPFDVSFSLKSGCVK